MTTEKRNDIRARAAALDIIRGIDQALIGIDELDDPARAEFCRLFLQLEELGEKIERFVEKRVTADILDEIEEMDRSQVDGLLAEG